MYQIVITSEFIRSLRDSTGPGGARATCDLAPCSFPVQPPASAARPRSPGAAAALATLAPAVVAVLQRLGDH